MLGQKVKEILDEHGIGYKSNSKSLILECPRCNKRDKLYIRKADGRFVCWVCKESDGFEGKPEFCLTELTGKPLSELNRALYGAHQRTASILNFQIKDFFGDEDEIPGFVPDDIKPVEPDFDFHDLTEPVSKRGVEYLESRGVPLDIALQYDIKYCPPKGAIVFPVKKSGILIGWQTRIVGPDRYIEDGVEVKIPKSMTSLDFKKDRALMFGDRIVDDHAILCEGPFDAIKAHLCGGNVATLGKAVSRYQLELLKFSGIKKLYIALDPDAFIESGKILKEMFQFMEIYDMTPPDGLDLGGMSMKSVLELYQKAPRIGPNHIFLYVRNPYVI